MSEEELEDLKWQQTEYEENIISELVKENEQLKSQLQQKENITKEVREYIKFLKEHYKELRTSPVEDSYFIDDMLRQMFIQSIENYLVCIEDILDKENK